MLLLLWDIWYHLKNYIFDRLEYYCLKRGEALFEVFGDGKVVESQLFDDFVFEGGFYIFLEGIIVSFDHLKKDVVG